MTETARMIENALEGVGGTSWKVEPLFRTKEPIAMTLEEQILQIVAEAKSRGVPDWAILRDVREVLSRVPSNVRIAPEYAHGPGCGK